MIDNPCSRWRYLLPSDYDREKMQERLASPLYSELQTPNPNPQTPETEILIPECRIFNPKSPKPQNLNR